MSARTSACVSVRVETVVVGAGDDSPFDFHTPDAHAQRTRYILERPADSRRDAAATTGCGGRERTRRSIRLFAVVRDVRNVPVATKDF